MRDPKCAVRLITLVDELRGQGSWCGETHVQKAVYVSKELHGVPLDLPFLFYKHGPFSFGLRDELSALRADRLLDLEVVPPYGPKFVSTELGHRIVQRFPKTAAEHREAMRTVARRFGSRNVSELERLATALFVLREGLPGDPVARLVELKPHVSREQAREALGEVEGWMEESAA